MLLGFLVSSSFKVREVKSKLRYLALIISDLRKPQSMPSKIAAFNHLALDLAACSSSLASSSWVMISPEYSGSFKCLIRLATLTGRYISRSSIAYAIAIEITDIYLLHVDALNVSCCSSLNFISFNFVSLNKVLLQTGCLDILLIL